MEKKEEEEEKEEEECNHSSRVRPIFHSAASREGGEGLLRPFRIVRV